MIPYPSDRMILNSEYDRGYSNGQRDILETLKRDITDRKRNSAGEPINNPKSSKIEAAAVEADELLKLRAEYQRFVDIADAYLNKLRYNQQYLIKCVVCNKMPPEEFGRKWHIAKRTVQQNRDRWLDKMLE